MPVNPPDIPDWMWVQCHLDTLHSIKFLVVFSGGLAWHFLSPPGHIESEQAHTHQVIRASAPPRTLASTMAELQRLGFRASNSGSPTKGYKRYFCNVSVNGCKGRLTLDLQVKEVPAVQCPGGWLVLRPDLLLQEGACGASEAAQALLTAGLPPEGIQGHPSLSGSCG